MFYLLPASCKPGYSRPWLTSWCLDDRPHSLCSGSGVNVELVLARGRDPEVFPRACVSGECRSNATGNVKIHLYVSLIYIRGGREAEERSKIEREGRWRDFASIKKSWSHCLVINVPARTRIIILQSGRSLHPETEWRRRHDNLQVSFCISIYASIFLLFNETSSALCVSVYYTLIL